MVSSRDTVSKTIHATCVAIGARGALLLGESGSGKSDLALRLIDRGAKLVSDDQVVLQKKNKTIAASAAPNIKGLLEVRSVGILKFPNRNNVTVRLVLELTEKQGIERLPELEFYDCMGIKIPKLSIYPFDASSPIKVEMALAALSN